MIVFLVPIFSENGGIRMRMPCLHTEVAGRIVSVEVPIECPAHYFHILRRLIGGARQRLTTTHTNFIIFNLKLCVSCAPTAAFN